VFVAACEIRYYIEELIRLLGTFNDEDNLDEVLFTNFFFGFCGDFSIITSLEFVPHTDCLPGTCPEYPEIYPRLCNELEKSTGAVEGLGGREALCGGSAKPSDTLFSIVCRKETGFETGTLMCDLGMVDSL